MYLRRKMGLGTAALVLGAITLPAGSLSAQIPTDFTEVPLDFTHTRHIPARPPAPDAASVVTRVANGTRFTQRPVTPTSGPIWARPKSFITAIASSTMPGFGGIGPSPIVNGAGGFAAAGPVSGRITGIAIDPADASNSTFYIAAAGGGVWKTTNGGSSYTVLTDSLPDTAMGSIAIDPRSHNTIYAGSGEASFSGDSRYGLGLYKSTDGGGSWTVYTGPGNAFVGVTISRIMVDPTNSGNVYLTTARGANGNGGGFGVYKSINGGVTWARVFSPGASCTDLAINPTSPSILYAAVGEIFGSGANGIYQTTNAGASWTLLTGFPNGTQSGNTVGRISMALAPSNPSVLYADYSSSGSSFGSLGGFFSTVNGGTSWTQAPSSTDGTGNTGVPNFLGGQGWYDNAVTVSPTNPSEVYAAGVINYSAGAYGKIIGLIGSFNGGTTWYDYSTGAGTNGPHTDHHALAFTPDGTKLLNGNDGGLWRLENPNVTPTAYNSNNNILWTDLNTNLAITQFTGIALHPTDPTIAYGGSQDNGTEKYTGSTGWTQVRGGDGGFTHVDQSSPNTVYHEYYGISLERSDNGGSSWTSISGSGNGINPSDPVIDDGDDPAAFYVPYVLDPMNQQRIIYGTNHVYESTNKGTLFTVIGTPGTAGFNPGGGALTAVGTAGSTVYAAAGANLYVTFNDGASWTAETIPGLGGFGSAIYVDPSNPQIAMAANTSFGGGHIFRTTNGGAAWTDISGNLPNEPFNAINRDARSNTLYAGGDDGVYFSYNLGSNWYKANMPNVQVVDIAVSPGAVNAANPYGLVAAGTHGRGAFEAPLPPYASVTALSSSLNPSAPGQSVILTAALTGDGSLTGVVTFKDGAAVLGMGSVSGGAATFTTSALSPGNHSLTASYGGDAATLASNSSTLVQAVTTVIAGTVSLQAVMPGNRGQQIAFTLTPTGTTGGGVTTQAITLNASDGSFTLPGVLPGTYTLGVKGAKWLRTDVTVDTTSGNIAGLSVSLLGGDLNGDNEVSLQDLGILRQVYGTVAGSSGYNPVADLTCDGEVSLQDLGVLRSNYGKLGAP